MISIKDKSVILKNIKIGHLNKTNSKEKKTLCNIN